MSLTLPRRSRGYSTSHRSLTVRSAAEHPFVLSAAAALIGACTWVARASADEMSPASTLAAAMALAVFAFAVMPEARSQLVRQLTVGHPEPSFPDHPRLPALAPIPVQHEPGIDDTQTPHEADGPMAPEPLWLQALRSRVRFLEAALEDRDASLAQARAQLEQRSRHEDDLARVRLTLTALRGQVSANSEVDAMLGRVEAAVSRLTLSPALQRATLPTRVTREGAALAPPASPTAAHALGPPPVAVMATTTLLTPPPTAATPTSPPMPEVPEVPKVPEASQEVAPAAVAPVHEERVLPVPAAPVQPVPRAGRWRRRGQP
jgi:hypothetical protein